MRRNRFRVGLSSRLCGVMLAVALVLGMFAVPQIADASLELNKVYVHAFLISSKGDFLAAKTAPTLRAL